MVYDDYKIEGEKVVEDSIDKVGSNSESEETSTPKRKMLTKEPPSHISLNHPKENILGNLDEWKMLRNWVVNQVSHMCHLSQFELKMVEEALNDDS